MSEQRLIDGEKLFGLIAGHSYYRGDDILSRIACMEEGREIGESIKDVDPEDLLVVRNLREKLSRYEKAEREGRLAFLNEPMIPTVRSDDPMDTDVYCPACGHDLSGGWEESPADEYRRMYQCPKCGQSINDMDCISKEEAEAALKERET